jgi:hypothetical protein
MGDGKSEAGSRVEASQKESRHHPIIFLLQHSSAPDFWLLGSLAPWLLLEQASQRLDSAIQNR